jgi:hypothetical protein
MLKSQGRNTGTQLHDTVHERAKRISHGPLNRRAAKYTALYHRAGCDGARARAGRWMDLSIVSLPVAARPPTSGSPTR